MYKLILTLVLVPDTVSADNSQLLLIVSGEIEPICNVQVKDNRTRLNLVKGVEVFVNLNFYCNQPMELGFHSQFGGLQLENSDITKNYLVEISVPAIGIDKEVNSSQLTQTNYINSGGIIPYSTEGQIAFLLDEDLTFAGRYSDTLTLSVAPILNTSQ